MKKIGLLLLAVIFGVSVSKAQPGDGQRMSPEDRAKRQTEEIKEAVGLNKDQEKKVYDLNLEFGKKMRQEMQANAGGGFEGMREKMQKMREEQDKKMKEILTADQWAKYQKYQEERRARRGQGGPGGNR